MTEPPERAPDRADAARKKPSTEGPKGPKRTRKDGVVGLLLPLAMTVALGTGVIWYFRGRVEPTLPGGSDASPSAMPTGPMWECEDVPCVAKVGRELASKLRAAKRNGATEAEAAVKALEASDCKAAHDREAAIEEPKDAKDPALTLARLRFGAELLHVCPIGAAVPMPVGKGELPDAQAILQGLVDGRSPVHVHLSQKTLAELDMQAEKTDTSRTRQIERAWNLAQESVLALRGVDGGRGPAAPTIGTVPDGGLDTVLLLSDDVRGAMDVAAKRQGRSLDEIVEITWTLAKPLWKEAGVEP